MYTSSMKIQTMNSDDDGDGDGDDGGEGAYPCMFGKD